MGLQRDVDSATHWLTLAMNSIAGSDSRANGGRDLLFNCSRYLMLTDLLMGFGAVSYGFGSLEEVRLK
jgi:hypothetical protein